MSKTIGSLLVKLGFESKEVDQGLKKFERNLKDAGKRMESVGRSMTIGFTAPFLLGIRQAIKAYDEEAQAVKKLEVALGGTSKALLDQAAAIQKHTVYSDDSVLSIQAWAAALGHSEGQIEKMTTAAVGLASGLGIGLDQAMSMLHKSTMGATKGLGQLVPGVKELTKEQLKSGEAIDLVTKKFGGFAEAAAKTGTGPLKVLQNQLGDISEDIGKIALPMVTKFAEKIKALAEWFDKLSPATKEFVVELGGMVALAGPVLVLAGNFIKLANAVKIFAGTKAGFIAMIAALKVGMNEIMSGASDKVANNAKQSYLEGGSELAYRAKMYGAATMSGIGMQYGQALERGQAAFGELPKDDRRSQSWAKAGALGLITPPPTELTNAGGWDDIIAPVEDGAKKVGETLVKASEWMYANAFSTPREAIDPMEHIKNFGSSFTSYSKEDGPDGVSSVGFGGASIHDYRVPISNEDLEKTSSVIDGVKTGFIDLEDTIVSFGDVFGVVMGEVNSALDGGSKSFGEYALSVVGSIAKVIQAEMMKLIITIVGSEGAKGGLWGAIAGLAGATAIMAGVSSAMSKAKAPALAEGGLAYGPTMAMVGDNRGASMGNPEVIAPLDKLRGLIGSTGPQQIEVVGMIDGDSLRIVTARSQGHALRRGSSNVIQF